MIDDVDKLILDARIKAQTENLPPPTDKQRIDMLEMKIAKLEAKLEELGRNMFFLSGAFQRKD